MADVWVVVVGVLAVVVAWQGLALLGLSRRLVEVENRQQGIKQSVLAYQVGDPVPGTVVGETVLGTPTSLALKQGQWLIIFATEGCSACGRTTRAAVDLTNHREDLTLAVLMPAIGPAGPEPVSSAKDHEKHESWLSMLTDEQASHLLKVPESDWVEWGAQGTPTAAIVRDGRLAAVDVGLATSELLASFLNTNTTERRVIGKGASP